MSHRGFNTYAVKGILLEVNHKARHDVHLTLGGDTGLKQAHATPTDTLTWIWPKLADVTDPAITASSKTTANGVTVGTR